MYAGATAHSGGLLAETVDGVEGIATGLNRRYRHGTAVWLRIRAWAVEHDSGSDVKRYDLLKGSGMVSIGRAQLATYATVIALVVTLGGCGSNGEAPGPESSNGQSDTDGASSGQDSLSGLAWLDMDADKLEFVDPDTGKSKVSLELSDARGVAWLTAGGDAGQVSRQAFSEDWHYVASTGSSGGTVHVVACL